MTSGGSDKPVNDQPESNAQEIVARYTEQLVRLASANIHPALLRRFDGEDVVQSVFRTFFRRQNAGQFTFDHSGQLLSLLVELTLRKTRSQARRHLAEKRKATAEGMMPESHVASQAPTAEDALAMWEEVDRVLDGLPDEAAKIISLAMEGHSRSDIAKEMNLSRQTIHRILGLIQERFTRRLSELSPPEA